MSKFLKPPRQEGPTLRDSFWKRYPKPPLIAQLILRESLRISKSHHLDGLTEEDVLQKFRRYCAQFGYIRAVLVYWFDVITISILAAQSVMNFFYLLGLIWGMLSALITRRVRPVIQTDQSKEPPVAPKFGIFLLKALVPRDRRDNAIGDIKAEFPLNWKEFNKWGAWFLFWEQVGVECFPTFWRLVRWLVWDGALRHLSDIFHKYVS